MHGKDVPKHMHYFEGGMRDNVDELLERYRPDIDSLRRRTKDVFPADQPDFYDDLFLLRFVMTHSKGGKECKMEEAEDALRKTLTWRAQHAELLKKTWETRVAPNQETCMKFNTCGFAGDLGGMEPIFVVRTGHCNSRGLMNTLTEDQVRDWLHFSREIAFRICDQRTRMSRLMIKSITVIDLAGWSIFAGDSRFEKCLQKASELSAIYYPQLLGKSVILNMPSFFKSIFTASMSLMPASVKDKISICPQNDTAHCGRDVTQCPFFQRFDGTTANVPPFLGGTKECPEALMPRSELESSLTKVSVAAGSNSSVEYEVPQPTCTHTSFSPSPSLPPFLPSPLAPAVKAPCTCSPPQHPPPQTRTHMPQDL